MEIYEYTKTNVNKFNLFYEINDNEVIITRCCDIIFNAPDDLEVCFEQALQTAEQTELESNVLPNHNLLSDQKVVRKAEIDTRTQELIAEGMEFDGDTFSLSAYAQKNWLALKVFKDVISWPKDITTKDDKEYSLAEADCNSFSAKSVNIPFGYVDSGRALKISIDAATTQAELDAVVDER
jgi:hypothetical protein